MKQYIVLALVSTAFASDDDAEQASTSYNENSCAYATTGGVVASPLGYCSTYYQMATNGRVFSYDFTHDIDADDLNWNYYSDLDCQTLAYTALPMDDEIDEGAIATQLIGSGDNCDTVEITKTGSYSPYSDECSVDDATADDYFTSAYVVNECIGASIDGQDASSVLMCDDKGVYFNYYAGCTDCSCDMQQYAHYYDDEEESEEEGDACHEMVCHTSSKRKRVHLRKNVISVDKANLPLFFKNGVIAQYEVQNTQGRELEISLAFVGASVAAMALVGMARCVCSRSRDKEYEPVQ